MSRSRWLLVAGVLMVLVVAGAILWLAVRPTDQAVHSGESLAAQGVAQVRVTLTAEMPPDFDDGIPVREITGRGLVEFERNVASVDYAVGDVPNAAGFFGHVDGDLSVIYEDSRFLVTFPVMANVLGDRDWMSYQMSDFSHPVVLDKGIGQLREIGLADPRIGFALASSGVGGEPDAEGRLPIDVAQAQAAVGPEVQPALQEFQELGVQQLLLETEVDEDGLLRAYSYDLAYPPAGSGREAKVAINVEITESGVEDSVEVPSESGIQSYLDYVNAS